MKRQIGLLVGLLVMAAVLVGAAAAAPNRVANCAGYCLYTSATANWNFDGQFHGRPNAPASKPWLRLSNNVDWKLTLPPLAGTNTTAEIHLGTTRKPGRLLAILCTRCRSISHGTLHLTDANLATIFATTPVGSALPVHAYVLLRTPKRTLSRQLMDA